MIPYEPGPDRRRIWVRRITWALLAWALGVAAVALGVRASLQEGAPIRPGTPEPPADGASTVLGGPTDS